MQVESGDATHHPVKPGQVWASNHYQDKKYGDRQHREVIRVEFERDRMENVTFYATVITVQPDGKRLLEQRVKCTGRSIKGHRLVSESEVSDVR